MVVAGEKYFNTNLVCRQVPIFYTTHPAFSLESRKWEVSYSTAIKLPIKKDSSNSMYLQKGDSLYSHTQDS